jgi:hypothetical protein
MRLGYMQASESKQVGKNKVGLKFNPTNPRHLKF